MSADIRLDPATLEAIAAWCDMRAQAAADVARAADPDNPGAAVRHVRGQAAAYTTAASHIRALMSEAEARPPLLSDWILACVGTALGEPHWSAERWNDSGYIVAWYRPDLTVSMLIDGEAAPLSAVVGVNPLDRRQGSGDEHYSPAELRSALDRLAAEPRP